MVLKNAVCIQWSIFEWPFYVALLGLDMLTMARTQHDVEAKAVSKFSVLLACPELGWSWLAVFQLVYFWPFWYLVPFTLLATCDSHLILIPRWPGQPLARGWLLIGFRFLQRSWRTSASVKGAMATLWRACAWGGHGDAGDKALFWDRELHPGLNRYVRRWHISQLPMHVLQLVSGSKLGTLHICPSRLLKQRVGIR